MMKLNEEYLKFIMEDIREHEGERDELREQLEGLFSSYDKLMECALHFYREMIKRGGVAGRATRKLKELGVDTDKLYSGVGRLPSNDMKVDYQKILDQREKVKNGLKIAYKADVSIEKCVELYTKYQNTNEVADELGVSHMTVRRRLKSAGL